MLSHAPDREDFSEPTVLYDGYYKVMPFTEGFGHTDRISVYVFGLADKWEKIKKPDTLKVNFNEIQFIKLDKDNRITDIRTEQEMINHYKNKSYYEKLKITK